MEYHSVINKKQLWIHITTWIDFKGILLNEEKPISIGHILYNIICIAFSKWQSYRIENRLVVIMGLGMTGKYNYKRVV